MVSFDPPRVPLKPFFAKVSAHPVYCFLDIYHRLYRYRPEHSHGSAVLAFLFSFPWSQSRRAKIDAKKSHRFGPVN